jgi:hypothetical protein
MREYSVEKDISANIEINLNTISNDIHESKKLGRNQAKKSYHSQKSDKFEIYASSLRYINFNFGAVLHGYKARRIYFNNSLIRQYRVEYRDLIQFAFMLQKEIALLKTTSEIEFATEQLRKTLSQMKSKREQFQLHFHYLMQSEHWLRQCRPSTIQDINYEHDSKFE